MNNIILKGVTVLLIQFLFINGVYSASCKGPHANDPGCITPSAPPALPVVINSVSIDWLNETIIVYGANFSGSTTVTIAGVLATINNQTSTQLDIAFPSLPKGNHNLVVTDSSGTDSISFFAKGAMVDSTLIGCPCETDWHNDLTTPISSVNLWDQNVTTCYELNPGGLGNPEDISGTVLSNASDPSVYPQYPIGAAFTEDPNESVCQLTEVSQSAVTDLVKIRINRNQQSACGEVLVSHICASPIVSVP